MRRLLLMLLISSIPLFLFAQAQSQRVETISGTLIQTIPSLKDFKQDPNLKLKVTRDNYGIITMGRDKEEVDEAPMQKKYDYKKIDLNYVDPLRANQLNRGPDLVPQAIEVDKNYDGMLYTNVAPADPTVVVGPNHVIQMINGSSGAYFKIWNKSGTVVVNQTYLTALVGGGYTAFGDPIVVYDHITDRYMMTEFGSVPTGLSYPNSLIVAYSQTSDPAGAWKVYKFTVPNTFVDYPKFAVWTNMYVASSNNFNSAGTAYLSSSIYAFDKADLLAGAATVDMQKVDLTEPASDRYYSMSPVNLLGTAPPAGTPGMIMYLHDNEWTTVGTDVDSIGIISFNVDFATPANTTVAFKSYVSAPFKTSVANTPVPGGSTIQNLNFRFMNRIVYRNFGTHQAIVGAQTVDAGGNKAGIRWSELRNTGANWSIYQEGTYVPSAGYAALMPSVTLNSKGQLAMIYNTASSTTFPTIRATGRNSTDPLGQMTYEEISLVTADGYGSFSSRWGDYNDLMPDPSNDSIFWCTAMYGSTNWKTRVTSFKLAPFKNLDAKLNSINSPIDGTASCSNQITPNITIKNVGNNTLTSLKINIQDGTGPVTTTTWTGSLPFLSSVNVALNPMTLTGGLHSIKIYVTEPNGGADEYPANDTARVSVNVLTPLPAPVTEGFEPTTFPTNGWRVINPNAGSITWARTTLAAKSGVASTRINFYSYSTTGHLDYLVSPVVDVSGVDSILVSFDRAYARYSATLVDTLMIQVSTDCGNTFPVTAWKKGGIDLATRTGTVTASYVPVAADWLRERVDIRPFIGNATSINISFTGRNGFGNNVYLDNVNISTVTLLRRDAKPNRVIEPFSRLCAKTVLPSFEFGSYGKDTLKSVQVVFNITGPSSFNYTDTINWVGNLTSGQTAIVSVAPSKPVNFTLAGTYNLKVFTYRPNGSNDQVPANDTLLMSFKIFDPQPGPIKESFEQTSFPPANWDVANSNVNGWQRNTLSSTHGTASAWTRNYRYTSNGAKDDLFSPLMQVSGVDSVFLTFDRAHLTGKYPGSTQTALDTLEVLITTDCGRTFTSVYKKWGEELQSIGDPNFPRVYTDTIGFRPTSKDQWKSDSLNLSSIVGANNRFQLVFRNTSAKGNNIYLDNINLYSVTLPAKLKQNGYLVTPNPFDGLISVRHYLRPVDLRGIQVTNSAGQEVFVMNFSGNAQSNIPINLSRLASGVYMMKLIYNNKVITERIVKRQ